MANLRHFIKELSPTLCFRVRSAHFLTALQHIDATNEPPPEPHSFYRGGSLAIYDNETRQAIAALKNKIDINSAIEIWEAALSAKWINPPVWVHGDISIGNLLV